jgi:hypothetical protein
MCPVDVGRPARGRTERSRGQTEIVGAILLFGLVVALLVLLQLSAVPASNARVEFDHSLQAQASVQELAGAALVAGVHDTESVVTVEYGTRYPSRLLLRSPSPAPGSLRTVDLGPVVLRNAVADGEALDYLNGSTLSFDTRAVEYRPSYNEYREAPVTAFEYPVTYNRFAAAERVLDGGALVAGDRLTLLLLDGEFATSQVSPGPVHLVPVSAATRPVAVTDDGDPLTLSLPTRLSNETWSTLLADEYVSAGGHVAAQRYVPGVDGGPATLVLEFETGRTYRLAIGRVAVERVPSGPEPARYLVDDEGNRSDVRQGEERVLSVEVRDRYNNPVAGVPVVADTTGLTAGNVTARDGTDRAVSDESGRAWFTYHAPETGVTGVEPVGFVLAMEGATDDAAKVPFALELRGSKAGGRTGGDDETGSAGGGPTFTSLSVTADDVNRGSPTVEQVTLAYETAGDLPVYEVTVHVEHRPGDGTPRTVATRGNLPGGGTETVALLVHGASDTNSWAINGQPDLRVTVTAVDTVGNAVTCVGIVEAADETVTLTDASDGGVPFACTPAAGTGGE